MSQKQWKETSLEGPEGAAASPDPNGIHVSLHNDGVVYGLNDEGTKVSQRYIGGQVLSKNANGDITASWVVGVLDDSTKTVSMYAVEAPTPKPRNKPGAKTHGVDTREGSPVPEGVASGSHGASRGATPSYEPTSRGVTPGVEKVFRRKKNQDRDDFTLFRGGSASEMGGAEVEGGGGGERAKRARSKTPGFEDDGNAVDEMTDEGALEYRNRARTVWFARKKHLQLSPEDMLASLTCRFLRDTDDNSSCWINVSPLAGLGVMSNKDCKPGTVVSMLCTTLMTHLLKGQLVWYYNYEIPWNKRHPLICSGGYCNSCGDDVEKANAGFFEFKVRVRNGVEHTVVFVITLKHVKKDEEILVRYPLSLQDPVVHSVTSKEMQARVESVGVAVPDSPRSSYI